MKVQKGKKRLFIKLVIAFAMCMVIFACKSDHTSAATHVHRWSSATCTRPRTCSGCGMTQGAPLGHVFVGTTCKICGMTISSAKSLDLETETCEIHELVQDLKLPRIQHFTTIINQMYVQSRGLVTLVDTPLAKF